MITTRQKTDGKTQIIDLVNSKGTTDILKNGKLYKNAPMRMVLVSSQSDLSSLTEYETGSIAYTAGLNKMWQKAPDGTWAEF